VPYGVFLHLSKQRINDMTDKNMVLAWASNVRGAEYGFFKAVVYALEQFQHKNNLPLTAMVAICNGKRFGTYKIVDGDRLAYVTPLKRILSKTLDNATLTFKDGKAKWKVGDNGGVNTEYLEALRLLCVGENEGRVSIRSQAFKDAFPAPEKKEPKPVEAMAAAEHIVKYMTDKGVPTGEVLALVQSMLKAKVVAGEEPSF
jgi:hypothetical protein